MIQKVIQKSRKDLSIGDRVCAVKWRDGGKTVDILYQGKVVGLEHGEVQVSVEHVSRDGYKVGEVESELPGDLIPTQDA